ncbi:GNAT family N-acetyltransferase [Pleomorphomonas oryzae]|uniref:GNAT family N-acetyltransferase n=1 Tax=Pleomorphomonas oryzae TaxID=261934 RepID=UPI001FDFD888|nr:GNAT family N-acetyltransferase [Pleomorphomonas oryzae]
MGYSVVPWKQGRGYATAALRALMELARAKGLGELQILCNVENLASRTVIERGRGSGFHGAASVGSAGAGEGVLSGEDWWVRRQQGQLHELIQH